MNKSENDYILPITKKIKMINKLGGCCKNCGETRFYVLDFHHADPNKKEFDWENIHFKNEIEIYKEISKCSVLCSNCHRKIHSEKTPKDIRYTQNKEILLKCIEKFSCESCGFTGCNACLSFHHINENEKLFNIGSLNNIRLKTVDDVEQFIINEMNKCIILCENCHRDIHFNKDKFEIYKDEIYKRILTYKPKFKINEEKVLELKKMNKTYSEICKELNCTKSGIHGVLKRSGML